jgi:predicted chitinase
LEKDYDFSTKDGTIAAIKQECKAQGSALKTQIAYVLATVEWETARTFKPVREAFWTSEDWRRDNLRYYPYYGRGYVQLTWKNNYQKYSSILGIDLVNNPDMAMEPNIALFILVHGFKTGTFTGRKITDYIDSHKTDFLNARRCINGLDKAHEIKKLAEKYLQTV